MNKTVKYIKEYLHKIKLSISKCISNIKSKLILINEFMLTTTNKEYEIWKLKDDKNLYTILIEWLTDFIVRYILIGLFITLALITHGVLGIFLKCTISYYILFKVLLLIKTGKTD